MATANPPAVAPEKPSEPARAYSVVAGLLSYLVPGLGQIYQGRIAKGLLFMVCLLGLFFYGMKLGSWSNVYMPESAGDENKFRLFPGKKVFNDLDSKVLGSVYKRLPFAGQFWIGVAAWPAVLQWRDIWPEAMKQKEFWSTFQSEPPESRGGAGDWKGKSLNELQADGDKTWDLGWVYTVIAGVLNILVIYDAFAGPAFRPEDLPAPKQETVPV